MRDPYAVLGLQHGASLEEVRRAYRRLAAAHHPDRHPDNASEVARFREVTAAFEELHRRKPRAASPGEHRHRAPGAAPRRPRMDDLVADFFGAKRGGAPPLQVRLAVPFQTALLGGELSLRYERLARCQGCQGTGGAADAGVMPCPQCGGKGAARTTRLFALPEDHRCPRCRGRGTIPRALCSHCDGRGTRTEAIATRVRVPAGTMSGEAFRSTTGGNVTANGKSGELWVEFLVQPHPTLQRRGADVHSELQITYPQATLGTRVPLETIHGTIALTVPTGTAAGTTLRLPGKGGRRGEEFGDHLVKIAFPVPVRPNERIERLCRELAAELQTPLHADESGEHKVGEHREGRRDDWTSRFRGWLRGK